MADITPTGPIKKTLSEYRDDREQAWKDALGADLNVDPETPQGQIIGIEAFSLSEADDSVIYASNQLGIYTTHGLQLDGLFSLLAIARIPASKTLVTVELAGVPATLIPAGTKAKTTAGDLFEIRDDATLDGTGNISAVAIADEFGPVQVAINELTQIVDVVPGWETIDNAAAGTPGEDQESDEAYLRRYLQSLSRNARSPLDSVLASVLAVENVTAAIAAENDTNAIVAIDGVSFAPHSLGVAVQGGVDADIASAIQMKKTIGAFTNGTTTVTVPQAQGNGDDGPDIDISFYRVTEIRTVIDIDITTNSKFPANGLTSIKEAIEAYFLGGFPEVTDGSYETDGIKISEDVIKSRLYTPINSVQGFEVISLALEDFDNPGDVDVLAVDFNERATIVNLSDITITVIP